MTRSKIEFDKLIESSEIKAESLEESALLLELLDEAQQFLRTFSWCKQIEKSFLGIGIGKVVGVFLFNIDPAAGADSWIWVIVGDIPPAYIAIDGCPNPACALDAYIGEMERWVKAVESNQSVDELIPVNSEPSLENAKELKERLAFIDREVLQQYREDLI